MTAFPSGPDTIVLIHGVWLTAFHEFPGRSHYTVGEEGWEAVADYALQWATANAMTTTPPVATC